MAEIEKHDFRVTELDTVSCAICGRLASDPIHEGPLTQAATRRLPFSGERAVIVSTPGHGSDWMRDRFLKSEKS